MEYKYVYWAVINPEAVKAWAWGVLSAGFSCSMVILAFGFGSRLVVEAFQGLKEFGTKKEVIEGTDYGGRPQKTTRWEK